MGAHGINGDDGPLEVEHIEQHGNGGDFIGFLADKRLCQSDSRFAGPGAHGVKMGGFATAAAAQGLAVDGDLAAFHGKAETGEMFGDASGERSGLDGLEDAREGVGAGDAVGQLEPLAKPVLAQFAKLFHEFVGSHPAKHAGKRDEEDFTEMVKSVPTVARVVDGREDFEAFRKALGIVGFIGISWHSENLKAQDTAHKPVRN